MHCKFSASVHHLFSKAGAVLLLAVLASSWSPETSALTDDEWKNLSEKFQKDLTAISVTDAKLGYEQVKQLREDFHDLQLQPSLFTSEAEDAAIRIFSNKMELRDFSIALLEACAGERGAQLLAKVAMDKTNPDLRYAAITALGYIGGHEDVLQGIVVGNDDADLRAAAVRSLGDLRHWGSAAFLREAYAHEVDDSVRCDMLEALGRIGDRSSVPLLLNEIQSEKDAIVKAAARGLSSCPDERAVRPLLELLKNPDLNEEARLYAEDVVYRVVPGSNNDSSITELEKTWDKQEESFHLAWTLANKLRAADTNRDEALLPTLTEIHHANLRSLTWDLLQFVEKEKNGQKIAIYRFHALQMLGEWGNPRGLYGLVGFLDEKDLIANNAQEYNWKAFRNRSLRVLRRATGQNFYLDKDAWLAFLDDEIQQHSERADATRDLAASAYASGGADADLVSDALITRAVELLNPEAPAAERSLQAMELCLARQALSRRVIAWQYGQQVETSLEPIIACAAAKSPAVRKAALSVLAQIGGERTTNVLIEALADTDASVQQTAASLLCFDNIYLSPAAAGRLETVFDGAKDPALRAKLAYSLCFHGDWHRGAEPLMSMWEKSVSDEERLWISSAMGCVGGRDVAQLALKEMFSPESRQPFDQASLMFLTSASGEDVGKLLENLPELLDKLRSSDVRSLNSIMIFMLGPSFATAVPDFDLTKKDNSDAIKAAIGWWGANGRDWSRSTTVKAWTLLALTDWSAFLRKYPSRIAFTEGISSLSAADLEDLLRRSTIPQNAIQQAQRIPLAEQLARMGEPAGIDHIIDILAQQEDAPVPFVCNQAIPSLRATTGQFFSVKAEQWREWWHTNRDAWQKSRIDAQR